MLAVSVSLLRRSRRSAEFLASTSTTKFRSLTLSALRYNAAPDWRALIGGREAIAKKRQMFETKYQTVLEAKASKEGISVDELKRRKLTQNGAGTRVQDKLPHKAPPTKGPVEAGSVETRETKEVPIAHVSRPAPSDDKLPEPQSSKSPVKPLNDIMDLSKAYNLTSSAVSQLWTTYHQQKGFLSAAIPTDKYELILEKARRYAMFILPLARGSVEPVEESEKVKEAVEMYLLQWALLPPPDTAVEVIPDPSTVLFTPLAEYKARQEYAQPYLILTHYTDLAKTHNIVLMRGEVTHNVALSDTDAQLLAVRLQLFYLSTGSGGDNEQARQRLLSSFHESPGDFDLDALIKTAWQL